MPPVPEHHPLVGKAKGVAAGVTVFGVSFESPSLRSRYAMPDFQSKNEGEFLRVEPNARVTYTWEWNGDGEVSTIDVVFTRTDGGTHIALTHEGLQTDHPLECLLGLPLAGIHDHTTEL